MLPTRQKVLRRFWYAVMPMSDLGDGPKPFTLLGEKIVLFRDADGRPVALQDRCAHRTSRLSAGRVINGNVACAYHGWEFNREGTCVRMPQLQEPERTGNFKIPAYHCTERYGQLWVCLGDPIADIPAIPHFGEEGWRCIHERCDIWDTAALRIIENAFDNAHFSYVHEKSFGFADRPEPAPLALRPTEWGFIMDSTVPVRNTDDLTRAVNIKSAKELDRVYEKEWLMPFSVRMTLSYANGLKHIIVAWIVPVDDQRTLFNQFVLRNDTEADSPAADVIAWDMKVTNEDRAILETTDWDVPLDNRTGEERNMPIDRPGIELRRRLLKLLQDHGEREVRRDEPGWTAAAANG